MARKKTTTNMSISHINSNSAVLLHSAVSGDHNNHKVPGQTLNHNFIFNQIKLITSALIDSGLNCCLAFAISLTHTGRERLCVCVCASGLNTEAECAGQSDSGERLEKNTRAGSDLFVLRDLNAS